MTFRKYTILIILLTIGQLAIGQIVTSALTKKLADGKMQLSDRGVEYFVNMSMRCIVTDTPHYNPKARNETEQSNYKKATADWPAFYGCYDWHSAVHNHWSLIKVLKTFPKHKLLPGIVARLDESFQPENIAAELKYFKLHELEMFEFPYGTSWLLKVADELGTWKDPKAEKWLNNLKPLVNYIVENYKFYWPKFKEAPLEGNHNNFAFGLSFAIDYAKNAQNDSLIQVLTTAAKKFYGNLTNYNFDKEPSGFDFMSGGLVIAELMRKVYTQKQYEIWLKKFAPKLFINGEAQKILRVVKQKKHNGYESHWDGYQLSRIWCLNGIMQSVGEKFLEPTIKKIWTRGQEQMWDYAQEAIGKGNYDIDHCLASFSVFALEGYR